MEFDETHGSHEEQENRDDVRTSLQMVHVESQGESSFCGLIEVGTKVKLVMHAKSTLCLASTQKMSTR